MPAAFLGTSWVILAILLLIFYAEPSQTEMAPDMNTNNNIMSSRQEGQIDEGFELQSKEDVADPMLQNGSRSRQHTSRNHLGSTTGGVIHSCIYSKLKNLDVTKNLVKVKNKIT